MSDELKIAKCARCSVLFVRIRGEVCHSCVEAEEADYLAIKEVLRENDDLNVTEVAKQAEVTEACVLRMLEQGLIVNEQVDNEVKCGKCGRPAISTQQRLCGTCLTSLDQTFYSEINEAKDRIEEAVPSDSVHVMLNKKRKKVIDTDQL